MANLPHRGRTQGKKNRSYGVADGGTDPPGRQSFNRIFKEYEERTGKKLNVTYRSESELKAAIAKNPADFASFLQLDWGMGGGLVGTLDQLSVSEYPDWNPKSISDVLYSQFEV